MPFLYKSLPFCLFLVLLSSTLAGAQPIWVTGYPKILSGASSVDITVSTNNAGTVYYGVYTAAQTTLTSVQLKSEALSGGNVKLLRRGSVTVIANGVQTINQTGMPSNATYYIYAVAESGGILMPDGQISATTRVFPKRVLENYSYSNAYLTSFLTYFPEDYYKTSSTFPLLIFLNGSGEMSKGGPANPDALLATGLPQVVNNGKEIPFIMAAPQGITSWSGSASGVDAFVEFLKVTYRINPSQIYLTGLSDGGRGVFNYADTYPSKVRKIVPVSTWPDASVPAHFINVPVWGFMGNMDTPTALIAFINALKALGGDATYTEYPGGHTSAVWNAVYDGSRGDDIYAWMLNGSQNPPPNIVPIVNAGIDQTASLPLGSFTLSGTASDPDGTIASLSWTEVSGPAVTMTNATTSNLLLTNITAGSYVFQLMATDNKGASTNDQVNLAVYPAGSIREFDVNITWEWNKQGGLWNDFITTGGGIVGNTKSLVDNLGVASSIAISVTAPFVDGANNHGVVPGMYPQNVMQYYLRSTQSKVGSLKLSGLNTARVYDVSILSSNTDVWYPSDTKLTVGGQTITINARGNANQLANFTSLVPTTSGELSITVAPATTNASNVAVINAMIIKEHSTSTNVPPVVQAGPDQQSTLPYASLQLTGASASDPDGTVTSLLWTEKSGPSITLSNSNTLSPILTNIQAGTYVLELQATDNSGASSVDQLTLVVNPAPTGATREFDVNVTWEWNKQNAMPWNDFITTGGGVVGNTKTLVDNLGVASPIAISVTAPFVDGANNHGVVPGMYPQNVMMYYLRSTTTKIGALKLSGLNTTMQYDLSILSSNVDVWYPSDTKLTVQGQTATVNAKGNANLLVKFTNIIPTGAGEIPITVAPATTNSTNVGVINAIILVEHSAAGARVMTPEIASEADPDGNYVHVFPNPVEDYIDVEIGDPSITKNFAIEITDVRGISIDRREVHRNGTEKISERIPADAMSQGIYILTVRGQQEGVKHFKILKR